MNPTTNTNGQRKSLASQIDRLDAMLDGLSDGLNDAVAQAVQGAVALAVKEAVQAVLTEVLTNPAVLAKLQASTPAAQPEQPADAPTPKGPGRFAAWQNWAGAQLKKAGECCRAGWRQVHDAGVALARRAARVVTTAATAVREEAARVVATGWLLGNVLLRLAAAFCSGVAVRVALFFTGVIVASPGDLRALLLAAVARCALWLRRLLAALPWWATRRPAWQVA
jgi:hypothetical protein